MATKVCAMLANIIDFQYSTKNLMRGRKPAVITRHSLVRAKAEVFVLLYVFLFFCFFVCSVNDFSATRGPIHAIFCMRA